jgi:hypothetical protein
MAMKLLANSSRRIARQLIDINIASSKNANKDSVWIKGNHINYSASRATDVDRHRGSDGLKVANSIMNDAADIVGIPVTWIKDMQQNWLAYVICAAVILTCVLVLYCCIRYRCSRPQQVPDTGSIVGMKSALAIISSLPMNNARHTAEG